MYNLGRRPIRFLCVFLMPLFFLGCDSVPTASFFSNGARDRLATYRKHLTGRTQHFSLPGGMNISLIRVPDMEDIHLSLEVGSGYADEEQQYPGASNFLTYRLAHRFARTSTPLDIAKENFYRKRIDRALKTFFQSPLGNDTSHLSYWSREMRTRLQIKSYADRYADMALSFEKEVFPTATRFSYRIPKEKLSDWLRWERQRLSTGFWDGFWEAFREYTNRTITESHSDRVPKAASRELFLRWVQRYEAGQKNEVSPLDVGARRFFEAYYKPSNMTLVLMGGFDASQVKSQIVAAWGGWRGVHPSQRKLPPRVKRFVPSEIGNLRGVLLSAPGRPESVVWLNALRYFLSEPKEVWAFHRWEVFTDRIGMALYASPDHQKNPKRFKVEIKKNIDGFATDPHLKEKLSDFQFHFFKNLSNVDGLLNHVRISKRMGISWKSYLDRVTSTVLDVSMFRQFVSDTLVYQSFALDANTDPNIASRNFSDRDTVLFSAGVPVRTFDRVIANGILIHATEIPGMLFRLTYDVSIGFRAAPRLRVAIPFWLKQSEKHFRKLGVAGEVAFSPNRTRLTFSGLMSSMNPFLSYIDQNFAKGNYQSSAFRDFIAREKKRLSHAAPLVKFKNLEEVFFQSNSELRNRFRIIYSGKPSAFSSVMKTFFNHKHKLYITAPNADRAVASLYQAHRFPKRYRDYLARNEKSLNQRNIWVTDIPSRVAKYRFRTLFDVPKTHRKNRVLYKVYEHYVRAMARKTFPDSKVSRRNSGEISLEASVSKHHLVSLLGAFSDRYSKGATREFLYQAKRNLLTSFTPSRVDTLSDHAVYKYLTEVIARTKPWYMISGERNVSVQMDLEKRIGNGFLVGKYFDLIKG